jgi:hypothetical protein
MDSLKNLFDIFYSQRGVDRRDAVGGNVVRVKNAQSVYKRKE